MNIELLNKEIQKLGKKYNLPILDTYSIFLNNNNSVPNPDYYCPDGLHLVQKGYDNWIKNAILPFIKATNFNSIGMVGNSITQGIEAYDWGKSDLYMSNWEYILKLKTYNLGYPGNTSFDIINRLDKIVSTNAECYFLLIGINDINQGYQIWETINNIEYIINYLTEKKSKVVLQMVMPII
jgi:lysophospholipase L1-like esterase